MSFSIVPPNNPSRPNISSSGFISRSKRVNVTWPAIAIFCGSKVAMAPLLVVRAEQQPTSAAPLDPEHVNQDDNKENSKVGNAGGGPNFPIPNIPSWAKWFLGSLFLLALPFYRNFLKVEDEIEKTATAVLDGVEKVAEVVGDVAEDVEKLLPENSRLKKFAQNVEEIAEQVDKDANTVESLVEKVDDVVDTIEAMVDPFVEHKIAPDGIKSTEETDTRPSTE